MARNWKDHERGDRIKWVIIFTAVIALAVAVTAGITKGFKDWNPYGWFGKKTAAVQVDKTPAPTAAVASNARMAEKAVDSFVVTVEGMPYTVYNLRETAAATDSAVSLTVEPYNASYAFKLVAVGTPSVGEYWDTGRLRCLQDGLQIYSKYPMPGYMSATPQYIDIGELIGLFNSEGDGFDITKPVELSVCQSATTGGGEPNFDKQTATYTFSIRPGNEPEDPATYTWYLYDVQTTGDYPATPPSGTGWDGIIGARLDWNGILHAGTSYDTTKQYRLEIRANGKTCIDSTAEVWHGNGATVNLLEHITGLTDEEKDFANFQVYWTSDSQATPASNIISFKMKKVKNLNLPETPTKEGYTFTGWYLDEACTQPYEGTPVTEDTVFYAGWKINQHTVTLLPENHTTLEPLVVDWGTVPALPELTRTGYDFVGWYIGDTLYENAPIKSDVTLTARWTIKRFTVTFMDGDTVYKEITVDWGTRLDTIAEATNLTGYHLMRDGVRMSKDTIITENTAIELVAMTKAEKFGEFIGRYWWLLIVGGGLVMVLSIAATVAIMKRR